MYRTRPWIIAIVVLSTASCASGGGGGYQLYPGPRLEAADEAIFVSYEENRVWSIDDQETAVRCWGDVTGPQPYRARSAPCRLHILPGRHSVVFSSGSGSGGRTRLEFTAVAGKSYRLDYSGCRGRRSAEQTLQRTCVVNVVEIPTDGGPGRGASSPEASR